MKSPLMAVVAVLVGLISLHGAARADDDDDDRAPADAALVLTRAQVEAVGIATANPVAASPTLQIRGSARVLDSAALIIAIAERDALDAASRATATEVERLRALHAGGAAASLKSVQAANAELVATRARADVARARMHADWGALAALPDAELATLLRGLRDGSRVLLRADLAGVQSLPSLPERASVRIDGIEHATRVRGRMSSAGGASGNAALLLELDAAPAGLVSGARLGLSVHGAATAGFVLPRSSLLHDERGAHVYQQLAAAANEGERQYQRRNVELLMAVGDGWLVRGVDADDAIVVRGVGLLWSIQGGAVEDDD